MTANVAQIAFGDELRSGALVSANAEFASSYATFACLESNKL